MTNERRGWAVWLLPSLRDILFIGIFFTVLALGPRLLNVDGDLGRHMTVGEWIITNQEIPTSDVFSHSMAGEMLTPHEWLSEVIFTLAFRWSGLTGVVILCALLLALTFSLMYHTACLLSGKPLLSFLIALLAAAVSSLHWLARPHLFTLLAAALWMLGMERARAGKTAHAWMLPVGMVVWANLHGAFIVGFAIWGAYGAGMLWDRIIYKSPFPLGFARFWAITGITSFAASMINPAGIRLWETSLGYLQNSYLVGHTAEYFPPDFRLIYTWPFLGMIALSLIVLAGRNVKQDASRGLLALAWMAAGLMSARNIPIFAVAAAPFLADGLGAMLSSAKKTGIYPALEEKYNRMGARLPGVIWPVVISLTVAFGLTSGTFKDHASQYYRFDPAIFPVEAVDWLKDHPQSGNVFNHFPWGGYLLSRIWPDSPVFIDGQTDFYGETLTREYEQVIDLQPGWKAVLDKYAISWVILPVDSEMVSAMQDDPDWTILHEDTTAIVLSRGY